MSQNKFESEEACQNYLHKHWFNNLRILMAQRGQDYFDQLTRGLTLLLEADRVYVASFDLEMNFATTIADFHSGEFRDNYDFHVPGTPYEEIGEGKSVLVEDGLADVFPETESGTGQTYRAMIGRPIYDEQRNVIGLISVLFNQPIEWINALNSIIDLCIVGMSAEMNSFYKSRQLNEMNHQLLRELALSNQLKEELGRLAYVDRVSGLPNREQFIVDIEARENLDNCWIALSGIDCFEPVNESMGLDSGDMLLKAIGEGYSGLNLIGTKVYKWTGDEYLTLGVMESPGDIEETIRLCDLIFQQPFEVKNIQIRVTRSTGVTNLSEHETIDDAIKAVCVAMQRAKLRGGNRAVFHEKSMNKDSSQFFKIYNLMQEGIQKQQFIPHYQPIYDPFKEDFVGYEALMRWIDEDGKTVFLPNQFIPVAERSGLIVDLGKKMIATAIADISRWNATYKVERDLAINLSPIQFHDDALVGDIEKVIRRNKIDPSLIKFEITESLFVHEGDYVLKKLNELKSIGFRLSLDDFGTGYSSLSYLQKYPFDIIKVDKCFVDEVLVSNKSRALIKAVRLLAVDLGMKIVAEGVESAEQAECLTHMGVDFLQGYYFSKPMAADCIDGTYQNPTSRLPKNPDQTGRAYL